MNNLCIDQYNQLLGIACHDGLLTGVDVSRRPLITVCISDSTGQAYEVFIGSVKYFYIHNFREGNIIDRMYLWNLSDIPEIAKKNLEKYFEVDCIDRLASRSGKNNFIISLECSYGAELFAVIEDESTINEYIKKIHVIGHAKNVASRPYEA